MRFTDQKMARWSLTLGLFALVSLILEMGHRSSGWTLLMALALVWLLAGRWARAAFEQWDGEINPESASVEPQHEFLVAAFIAALAGFHLLFYVFEAQGQFWIRNPNLTGDLPFHWHQIQFLAKTESIWPANPIFAGDHLRYAFGVNWLASLAVRFGLPIEAAFLLPLFLGLIALFFQLWRWLGLWAVVIFFLSGGGWWLPAQTWWTAWMPGDQVAWKNFFLAIFVTQRGFLFALPVGIFWIRYLDALASHPWTYSKERARLLLVLWAVMPLFHLHTFVVLSLYGAATLFASGLRQEVMRSWRGVVTQVLCWAPIPVFLVLHATSQQNVGASLRWVGNWISDRYSLPVAWGVNYGLWLPLVIMLLGASLMKLTFKGKPIVDRDQTRSLLVWLGGGVLFSHLMLAPWNWDQTKVLIWVYLGLSMVLGRVFFKILPRSWVFAVLLMLSIPGLFQFMGGLPPRLSRESLWSLESVQSVRSLLSSVSPEERVLIAPDYHHPLFATGQPVVAGYMGHLWSHGLPIQGLEDKLKRWMRDPAEMTDGDARYLIWGPPERQWLKQDEPGTLQSENSNSAGENVGGGKKWVMLKEIGAWRLYRR